MDKMIVWNVSVLSAAIGIIGKAGVKLESRIQAAAVQCVAQSILHRNATPAQQLYDALPRGSRHDALAAFFEMFGNLAYSSTDKAIVFFDTAKQIDIELAWTPEYAAKVNAFHWTNGTIKPAVKSMFDASEEINKLLARLTKLTGDTTKEVKHADLVAKVVAVVQAYDHAAFSASTTGLLTQDDKDAMLEQAAAIQEAEAILDGLDDVESEAGAEAALDDVAVV